MEEKLTLLDLQEKIKRGIEGAVPGAVWVTAEIGELNNHYSGHCYLDLIDYKEGGRGVAAKARGVIWSNVWRMLKPYFETTSGVRLEKGLHVLLKAQVSFSPVYGLSLNILDIDPAFTVGELELRRQKAIERLKGDGCMEMNPSLQLPALPRRIAVVSAETAAGYRDFMKQLHQNENGFRFCTELFAAQMQGDDAPQSIVSALERIAERADEFDVAIIIRGGGAAMDLVCFDDYNLALNIAQFPLPVITGIGHDHDFHIADMVAHTWLKTPTAVADFFVGLFVEQEQYIMYLFQRISLTLTQKISVERQKLALLHNSVVQGAANLVSNGRRTLDMLQLRINAANPAKILGNGFAIVAVDGKRASVEDIREGCRVRMVLADGTVEFTVGEVSSVEKRMEQ
ncbi:MAG: exodeoxyribonuclease VII large subunit [Bacteroidales bacterium]|nr:exodeoxyribonuclease VII large subunit [Bacteroidales bacterium]